MRAAPSIRRPRRIQAVIPSASMADIAFLLLIFFLTCTIFRFESGLSVLLPEAATATRVTRQKTAHVWVDRGGTILMENRIVPIGSVAGILARRMAETPDLTVALEVDTDTPYEKVDLILLALKQASIRNVSLRSRPPERAPEEEEG